MVIAGSSEDRGKTFGQFSPTAEIELADRNPVGALIAAKGMKAKYLQNKINANLIRNNFEITPENKKSLYELSAARINQPSDKIGWHKITR